MHSRISVHLRGAGEKDLGLRSLREPEHVDRTVHGGLGGLHRIALVVDRAGRARQVVDLVDFHVQREGHIVPDHLEPGVIQQVGDVVFGG